MSKKGKKCSNHDGAECDDREERAENEKESEEQIEGQMSLSDYEGVVP